MGKKGWNNGNRWWYNLPLLYTVCRYGTSYPITQVRAAKLFHRYNKQLLVACDRILNIVANNYSM